MPHRFTSAEAKAAAALSAIARKERNYTRFIPELPELLPLDGRTQDQLKRLRLQVDRINGMFFRETDPRKLDLLASAQARLQRQERELLDQVPTVRRKGAVAVPRVVPQPVAPESPTNQGQGAGTGNVASPQTPIEEPQASACDPGPDATSEPLL